ncbi:hypothetical protein CsatB_007939 [Cannabis sativa]|uniref:CP12 domain-containing protein n=2 Tax=Cannabis sativa TaxID=3483 RepID=A0AB40E729_CANSA|nr:calvin cycle protein CP12-3, chloroplastic [Cannabis sativa]KAF4365384.1 hypothetical protein G4B88_014934 [Cannabis sativa]KAF4388554.1 hypothetical protein F8388_012531 [Cannabis sativa]
MGSLPILNLSLSSINLCRRGLEGDGGGGKRSSSGRVVRVVRAMAVPKFKGTQLREQVLTEMIEKKVKEAEEVCGGKGEVAASEECKVAWDEVEELSQAKADFRRKLEKQDPLEYFCQDNPETDECWIYDD